MNTEQKQLLKNILDRGEYENVLIQDEIRRKIIFRVSLVDKYKNSAVAFKMLGKLEGFLEGLYLAKAIDGALMINVNTFAERLLK